MELGRDLRPCRYSFPKKSGRAPCGARPSCVLGHWPLKLEPSGKLNLALTEQRAVSAGNDAERRVKRQGRAGEVVKRTVHARDLRTVEQVEGLCQHFQLGPFSDAKPTRETHVEIPDVRLLEEVARGKREAVRSRRNR